MEESERNEPILAWAHRVRDMGHGVAFVRAGSGPGREEWNSFPLYRMERKYAQKRFDEIVEETGTDVVHCQDTGEFNTIFPGLCRARNLPCLFTVSDFTFRCPRGDLIRGDGTYCSPSRPPGLGCAFCLKEKPDFIYPASLIDRMMGSRATAFASAALPRRWASLLRGVDFVIAPSPFIKTKCREGGIDDDRVVHVPRAGGSAPWERLKGLLALKDRGSAERCARELVIKYRQAVATSAWNSGASCRT